jgi:glycine/D-amino acid oxidase-like deaminating enzyme
MIRLNNLSFWEKDTYLNDLDFVVIGAGIVGYSTAFFLKEKYPSAKILILERGILPSGASTKNAGFTCFGSPTELFDDLQKMSESTVWETVRMRYEGLQFLKSWVGEKNMNYQPCGSWDLIKNVNEKLPSSFISHLNEMFQQYVDPSFKTVYSEDENVAANFGFKGVFTSYFNALEGAIDTGKLMHFLYKEVIKSNIHILFGTTVHAIESDAHSVLLKTSIGEIKTSKLAVCTNGFTQQFFQQLSIQPARAQVLITHPIPSLNWRGTFHYDAGYYYFRNVGNRLLIGGGRNIDFEGETTTDMQTTSQIQSAIEKLMQEMILPNKSFTIEQRWSGIMGVGTEKKPLIQMVNKNIGIGVRLGGMGVAIGVNVGKSLSKLF